MERILSMQCLTEISLAFIQFRVSTDILLSTVHWKSIDTTSSGGKIYIFMATQFKIHFNLLEIIIMFKTILIKHFSVVVRRDQINLFLTGVFLCIFYEGNYSLPPEQCEAIFCSS